MRTTTSPSAEAPHVERRRRTGTIIIGAVVLLLAVFTASYFAFFHGSSKSRLTVASGSSGAAAGAPTGPLAGHWVAGPGSVTGYRVREKLGPLPAPTDAVGRTSAVTGGVTIDGKGSKYRATNANFTADVSQLTSDKARRDSYIKTHALQTTQFPQATFVVAGPLVIPADAVTGATATVPATGDLTIHGVTKTVTIPLQVRRDGANLDIAGSLQFPFSDFKMSSPDIAGFVTIQSAPTLEFTLVLHPGQ